MRENRSFAARFRVVAGRVIHLFNGKGAAAMRKPRRWPTVLVTVFFALGLLLLLSALVEAPAGDAHTARDLPAVADAMMLTAAPSAGEAVAQARAEVASNVTFAMWALFALALPLLVSGTDANGRVLRRRSYARSYYPVFRQELACG